MTKSCMVDYTKISKYYNITYNRLLWLWWASPKSCLVRAKASPIQSNPIQLSHWLYRCYQNGSWKGDIINYGGWCHCQHLFLFSLSLWIAYNSLAKKDLSQLFHTLQFYFMLKNCITQMPQLLLLNPNHLWRMVLPHLIVFDIMVTSMSLCTSTLMSL